MKSKRLTGLVSANLLKGALVLVALGDNGRHIAAGLAVATGRLHGRHFGQSVEMKLCLREVVYLVILWCRAR